MSVLGNKQLRHIQKRHNVLSSPLCEEMTNILKHDDIDALTSLDKKGIRVKGHVEMSGWLKSAADTMSFKVLRYFRAQGVDALPLLEQLHVGSKLRKGYADMNDMERIGFLLNTVFSKSGRYAKTALALLCFEDVMALRRYIPEELTIAECLQSGSLEHCRYCEKRLVSVIAYDSLNPINFN